MGTKLIFPYPPPAEIPKPVFKKGKTVRTIIQVYGLYMTLQFIKMIFLANIIYTVQVQAATVQMI